MQFVKKPTLKLVLKPQFDKLQNAVSICIALTIESPNIQENDALYLYCIRSHIVNSFPYKEESIIATDDDGQFSIHFRESAESKTEQEWCVSRSTTGNVTLQFTVKPRTIDEKTPVGPRIDLRSDQGGLQGVGRWFLPRPPTNTTYRNIVVWDFSESPEGTRGVWSYGEGPNPIEKEGLPRLLWNTVYMVGPIQSYPAQAKSTTSDYSTMYWFGSLPSNVDRLKEYNTELFLKMSSFFDDPAGPNSTYRTYVRKVLRGFGGGGYLGSYVLEIDNDISSVSEVEMISLLSHEMVHSWAIIDAEDDGNDNFWYEEGIAEFYSAFLPWRFGLQGAEYLQTIVNGFLSSYFTNPSRNISNRQAQDSMWESFYSEYISYARGFVYLLLTDCRLEERSNNPKSHIESHRLLDMIVVNLSNRRKKGEKLQAREWLDLLAPYIGKEFVETSFKSMDRGELMDLSPCVSSNIFPPGYHLKLIEQEIMEVGFSRKSFNERVISGLVKGSRAELAGLKDGDRLLRNSTVSECVVNYNATIRLNIERNGQEMKIEYWPRRWEKVNCWQLEKVEV